MKIEQINLNEIKPYYKNPRRNDRAVDKVAASIQEFGFNQPIVVDQDMTIVVGHTRYKAAQKLKLDTVPVLIAIGASKDKLQAYRIADNKLNELAEWDMDLLLEELQDIVRNLGDSDITGFDITDLTAKAAAKKEEWKGLNDKYLMAPFSVLDTNKKEWMDRKRTWESLGIRSEEGRDAACMVKLPGRDDNFTGVSIFDPVLTEVLYSWYSAPGMRILDPFAGGSVRGIVARMIGRHYTGIDLRQEQISANELNWADLQSDGKDTLPLFRSDNKPELKWIAGDSLEQLPLLPADDQYDLVFTCPPYADLEVYSDDPKDISNMEYSDFMRAYTNIIKLSADRLKDNRFMVIVVGEVRSSHNGGAYYNFVGHTIQAAQAAGLSYYNEVVLLTVKGPVAMTAGRPFNASRKLGKVHQNALVFVKGDGKQSKEDIDSISDAFYQHDHTGQLAEKHEKILIFAKGNPKKAAKDLGSVEFDDLADIERIQAVSVVDRIIANLNK
jgi:DNA modification methylase